MYDYHEAIKEDVQQYIKEEINLNEFETIEELENYLNDVLWTDDSVTGNGSGSYTFSTYQAEEYICHNLELLDEALTEFSCDKGYLLERGAEAADVTIRCYLLGSVIHEVVEELNRK